LLKKEKGGEKMGWFFKSLIGAVCVFIGFLLSLSIVGAIIGIPLIAIGAYLAYKGQEAREKGVVKKALQEIEEERKIKSPA